MTMPTSVTADRATLTPPAPPRFASASVPSLADGALTPLRRRDARQTVRSLTRDVRADDQVLDLGCGSGFAGATLEGEVGCTVVGCDVVPMNRALRDFHLFDGSAVPFGPDAFDVTLLAYVLHHVPEPLALLREAARVTRRTVIVVEDTPRCLADRLWGHLHVYGFNGTYGLPHGHVRSEEDWLPLFELAGLTLVRKHAIGRLERFPPNARTQYTLAPEAP